MKFSKEKLTYSAGIILAALLLTACGGGTNEVAGDLPGAGSGTGAGGGGAGNPAENPPQNITISVPVTDAIENLGGGIYRARYTAAVTDKEGNAVPDGTRINLFVIDTIKASGTIEAGLADSISGFTLTDSNPFLGDGITPATSMNTAKVNRENTSYVVSGGDHLLLFNAARGDKARIITGVSTNSVTVSTAFANTYPNTLYPGTGDPVNFTYYAIGASKNGAYIEGEGGERGVAITKNGQAAFYMIYPSDVGHIMNGCTYDPDTRTVPSSATGTYIIATDAKNLNVSTVYNTCFSAISGGTLVPSVSSIGPGTTNVTLTLRDGGDSVRIPFTDLDIAIDESGGATLSVTPDPITVTNSDGVASISITASGSSTTKDLTGVVTVYSSELGVRASITATIPRS